MTFKEWSRRAQADRDRIGATDVSPIAGMSLRSRQKREAGEDMAASYERYRQEQEKQGRERQAQYTQAMREYESIDFDAVSNQYDSWQKEVNRYLENPQGDVPDSSELVGQTEEIRDLLHRYGGLLENTSSLYAAVHEIDDHIESGTAALDRSRMLKEIKEGKMPWDTGGQTVYTAQRRPVIQPEDLIRDIPGKDEVLRSYPSDLDDQVKQAYTRFAEAEGIFNNYSGNDKARMDEMMRDMDEADAAYRSLLKQQQERDKALQNAEDNQWLLDAHDRFSEVTSMPDFVVDEDVVKQHRALALHDLGDAAGIVDSSRMTDEEVAVFGYVYGHEGTDAALDYLKYISRVVNARAAEEEEASAQAFAEEHPFLASLGSIPQNLVGGMVGAADLAGQYLSSAFTGEPVDYNSPNLFPLRNAQTMRSTVAENIDNGILSGAYQIGMSIVDNAASAAIQATTGIPAAAILSTGAGASAAQAAKERGGSDGQVLAMGLLAGAAEQVFESVSFGRLFELKDAKTAREVVGNVLRQMGTEASEELATSIANWVSDSAIMLDKSEDQQAIRAYMEQGMSEEEATRQAFYDRLMSFGFDALAGGISGGVLGGGATIVNHLTGKNSLADLANKIDIRAESSRYGDQARAMEATYLDGQDPVQYAADYNTAFEYGRSGASRESVPTSTLTDVQTSAAYDTGRAASRAAREVQSSKADTANGSIGFVRNEHAGKVSEQEANYLDALGKASKTRIQIGPPSNNGYDGYYQNGVITIAEDAADRYSVVAAHEVTHRMKEMAPAQYQEYSRYALRVVAKRESLDNLIDEVKAIYKKNGITLTDGEAADEIAADFTKELMENVEGFRDLAKTDRSMAQRLVSAIRSFVQRIKNVFSGNRRRQDQAAMDEYGVGIRDLENVAKAWGKALRETEKQAGKTKAAPSKEAADYWINPDFSRQIDNWDGVTSKRFLVGRTSKPLQSIGIQARSIYWDGSKIRIIQEDHPNITIDIIKQVPHVLEDPALVLESKQKKSRIVIFGDVFDANGKPVTAILELEPKDRGGEILNIQMIASAYAKEGNLDRFVKGSNVLYLDPDRKRTERLLSVFGVQFPSGTLPLGSIGTVSYDDGKVKVQGISWDNFIKNSQRGSAKFSIKPNIGASAQSAVQFFGRTSSWNETGYLLEDGTKLDFSGRHEGAPGGYRTVDHRDILDAFDGDYGDGSYSGSMIQFMQEGNIRISPESGGINLMLQPTRAQETTLRDFISKNDGEVILDIDKPNGDTVASVEYPSGTKPSKVLSDIRNYFSDGTIPEVGIDQFRYSLRNRVDIEYLRGLKPSSIRDPETKVAVKRFQSLDRQKQQVQTELEQIWDAFQADPGNASLKRQLETLQNRLQNVEGSVNLSMKDASVKSLLKQEHERILQSLSEEYGTIPTGENPSRRVSVPAKTGKEEAVGRFARTAMEAKATPDEMLSDFEREIVNGTFSHTIESDEKAVNYAETHLARGDAQEKWDAVVNGSTMATKNDIALGEALYIQAAEQGDAEKAMKIAAELCAEATRAGQVLQAVRLLKKMSGAGQMYYIDRVVENMQQDLDRRLGEKRAPELYVPDELRRRLSQARTKQEQDAVMEDIKNSLASQMPVTWMDKWNAWRYFAMLGNPRTHIRNLVGNAVFAPAVQMKRFVQTGIESAAEKAGLIAKEDRTSVAKVSKEYRDFAREDFEEVQDLLKGGGRNFSDDIRDRTRIFKNRVLESARRANFNALEWEDGIFLKNHYIHSLASVLQARGIDVATLDTSKPADMQKLLDARVVAIREAQKATYRDASAFATALNRFSKSNKAASLVVESLLPFKKTPANVLKRGVEYSPAQLALSTGRMMKQIYQHIRHGETGDVMRTIDGLASGLTGTGIMTLGMYLASQGLLSGGYGDDEEDKFDRLTGGQEYALQIGDSSYTIDWAAPVSLPLFVGVELWKQIEGEYGDGMLSFGAISNALQSITEPMFNLSMLDGLNSALSSLAFSDGNELMVLTQDMVTSYLGQLIPTLFGQIARTIDPTRRTTFTDKDSEIPSGIQYFLDQQQNKIPGATFFSQPFLDAWGREQTTESFLERAFENFLSPGYMSSYDVSDMERELQRVYGETGNASVFPKQANRSVSVGVKVDLSGEEYVTYQTSLGQNAYSILESLVTKSGYKKLPDAYKAKAISKAYELANNQAKDDLIKSSERIQDILTDRAKQKDKSAKTVKGFTANSKWATELIGSSPKKVADTILEHIQDDIEEDQKEKEE